jgi:methyltransferase (TIGR00027 family)
VDAASLGGSEWAGAWAPGERNFVELMSGQVAVRTRFFDETLLHAAENGHSQVVLLACGMDTRAFRLGWPAGTTVFESRLRRRTQVQGRCTGRT